MIFDPAKLDRRTLNGLINGLVIPRPVAWVSTIGKDGKPNLAPFSFFNAFSFAPPTVAIGPGTREGVPKDTLRNIRETKEFAISVVTEELAGLCNATSAEFPPEVNEWEALGIESEASETVAPRRVKASPVSFECKLFQIVDLGTPEQPSNSLIIGRVNRIFVADEMMDGARPKSEALRLVARMGGAEWCKTRDKFELKRPDSKDPKEVRRSLERQK